MPNDMDMDVEIQDDDLVDDDMQDSEEEPQENDPDVDALAEQKASQMLNNTLANLAIQDPEFAEYLRRRSGVEPEGKSMDIPKKQVKKSAEIPEEIAETLSEMETNHLRQIEQLK